MGVQTKKEWVSVGRLSCCFSPSHECILLFHMFFGARCLCPVCDILQEVVSCILLFLAWSQPSHLTVFVCSSSRMTQTAKDRHSSETRFQWKFGSNVEVYLWSTSMEWTDVQVLPPQSLTSIVDPTDTNAKMSSRGWCMAVLRCWIGVVWLLPLMNETSVHLDSSTPSSLPLRTLFWSRTAGTGVTLQEHSDETKKFWQSNYRHKLAWTMRQYGVSPARVINADGTCVRLLPANTYGWSQAGSKASQIWASKAAVTDTLAVPWMPLLKCTCSSFSSDERVPTESRQGIGRR